MRRKTERERAEERQRQALLLAHNRCIEVLADLPDPRLALLVVEGLARGVREFIALQDGKMARRAER